MECSIDGRPIRCVGSIGAIDILDQAVTRDNITIGTIPFIMEIMNASFNGRVDLKVSIC